MREKLLPGLIAVVLVTGLVAGILYTTRNNAVQLEGQILKVRSQTTESGSTIAIIDFRVHNPSTQQFLVRDVAVKLDVKNGRTVDGAIFREAEIPGLLHFYTLLGPKYNQTLLARDKIESGQSIDRMLAVQFPLNDDGVQTRGAIRIFVTDVDGATKEIREQR